MTLGCVSAGVSEAGGIRRVRTVRRGRRSCKMWPRQHLRGDPCEKVPPVPELRRGAACAGQPSPGPLPGSSKTGAPQLYGVRAIQPL